jgi:hypothetical protein
MLRNTLSSTAGSEDGAGCDNANFSKKLSLDAVDFDKLASSVQGEIILVLCSAAATLANSHNAHAPFARGNCNCCALQQADLI